MPFLVGDLIEGRGDPVTVTRDRSVKNALDLMIEHDFDQLPVVSEDRRHLGMVTHGSILRSLNSFDVKLDSLRVSDALTRARSFRKEDDLFDLLNELRERFAVPIVDGAEVIVGIVTSYDTTEYFRRKSEDLMLVEDIELALRQYIRIATGASVDEDNAALREAVADIMPSGRELKNKYKNAVRQLLNLRGENTDLDPEHIELTFSRHLRNDAPVREFSQLTLAEYIDLFLHSDRWHLYEPIFVLDQSAIRHLLDEVRQIRNNLMHFGGDLDTHQRELLRFCSQWLNSYQQSVDEALLSEGQGQSAEVSATAVSPEASLDSDKDVPPLEGSDAREGKYAPLAAWLQALPASQDNVELTFQQIEAIIGDDLPPYARAHQSWWANDSVSRVQSQQWLNVGWATRRVNMTGEKVTFVRLNYQKRKYIEIFGALMNELQRSTDLPVRQPRPDGRSWHHVARLPDQNPHPSFLAFAFARDKRFRVELYIDTGDAERNKLIFDALDQQKEAIETALGEPLSWERLEGKRASRVALYREATINDGDAALQNLQEWAVPAMIKFRAVISEHLPTDI
jgi:CBS domain-containing protein